MIYFYLKPDAECFTFCQEKTRNKPFTNVCIYFLTFLSIYIRGFPWTQKIKNDGTEP